MRHNKLMGRAERDRAAWVARDLLYGRDRRPASPMRRARSGSLRTFAMAFARAAGRRSVTRPAPELARQIRAFNPFPGCQTDLHGAALKIWQASPGRGQGAPGEILSVSPSGICVACGDDALILEELQQAGGKRLPVAAFLAGHPLQPGDRLGPTE